MSDWRWTFVCVGHNPELFMPQDDGHGREEMERLWAARRELLALDQEFWPQEHYRAIWWLSQHRHCPVALDGPKDERVALPAAGEPAGPCPDLDQRRAVAWLSREQVLRAIGRAGQGFQVRAVFADTPREAVGVVVVHPELPVIAEFHQPYDLRSVMADELRVIDGEVWVRQRLAIELPGSGS